MKSRIPRLLLDVLVLAVVQDFLVPRLQAQAPATWLRLLDFNNGEYLKYGLATQVRGERVEGWATLDFTEKGKDRLEIRVEGAMGGKVSSSLKASFGLADAEKLVSGEWATTDAARVLAVTVFSPSWPLLFAGKDLKAGSRWSGHEGEVESSVEVSGSCIVAGLKGFQGRWVVTRGGRVDVETNWCISPDIPLPLRIQMHVPKENSTVEVILATFRPAGAEAPRQEVTETPASERRAAVPEPSTAGRLQGLYAGTRGTRAALYFFTPTGRVAMEFKRLVDPEAASQWPTTSVPIGEEIPEGDRTFDVSLGTYAILGDRIQLRTREMTTDPDRQTLWLKELWKENWEKDKIEGKTFKAVPGFDRIEIDGTPLMRQKDQTGRKLDGENAHESFYPIRTSVRATFTRSGEFSLDETWVSATALPTGGGNKGSGRYEIRGHEIILAYSDGRVEKALFTDLGLDEHGRALVGLRGLVLTRGLFNSQ